MTQRTANGPTDGSNPLARNDRVSAAAWTGRCTGCHLDAVEVASRREHFERVLCETCAARTVPAPLAIPGSVPIATHIDDMTWRRWERARASKPTSPTGPREAVIDAATAPSGRFECVDVDTFHTLCWLCVEPLAVRFKHLTPSVTAPLVAVEFECLGGCAETDLEATMFEGLAA